MARRRKSGSDDMMAMTGRAAFLVGVLLALVFGFVTPASWLPWVLVVAGLVIGLLNISEKEVSAFLTAGTVLVLMGYFGGQTLQSVPFLGDIFNNLLVLFIPATVIVALKHVFSLARD